MKETIQPTFLLFSGHNNRAVLALCRFFTDNNLSFVIVSAGQHDAIHCTAYRNYVILNRINHNIDLSLFEGLTECQDKPLVYCPTTEFINQFVLDNRIKLEAADFVIGLPHKSVYQQLTSKLTSQALIHRLTGIRLPLQQDLATLRSPCVLKPRVNLVSSRILYPVLCLTQEAVNTALSGIDPSYWFAQDYVDGQSYYLCGYLSRRGEYASYWQENLLQQDQGKSIVLARTCANPGFDVEGFFKGLTIMGYHGPLMLELIQDAHDNLYYIEINPRFWGPLALASCACPQVMALFARDHGATCPIPSPKNNGPHWYSWAFGAGFPNCRCYPGAADLGVDEMNRLIVDHDIYANEDTILLHLTY